MSRSIAVRLLFITALFGLLLPGSAAAANVCFQCHQQSLFQGKVVHKPVADGQCSACHNPHVARFKGLLRLAEGPLCYSCHPKQAVSFKQGFIHEPVRRGNCTACHDPHASSVKDLVHKDLARDCLKCHTKLPAKFKYTHEPYAKGQCLACHSPHHAANPLLLKASADTLCRSCHKARDLRQGHRNYPGPLKDCLTCHNPHGSNRPDLVRNFLHKPYAQGCSSCHKPGKAGVSMAVCFKCHPDVKDQMLATHSHISRHKGNSCLNCHSPHAGDDKSLLKGREEQVCAACHQDTMKKFRDSPYKHNNINNCSNCHEPHGSRNLAMLKGNGTAVCARCHKEQRKFTHPIGPKVLDPRTGHPISCVTCHNPMGTDYKFHLVANGNEKLCRLCHRNYL